MSGTLIAELKVESFNHQATESDEDLLSFMQGDSKLS